MKGALRVAYDGRQMVQKHMDPLGRHMNSFPHEMSATDTWYTLVGSRLHAQRCPRDLSTIITEILAYLFVTLLAWILEYQHMMLCVWRWIPTNVECRWPAGEDRRTVGPPSQRLTQQCPEWRYMHCSVLSAISALTKWSNTSWADCSINSRAIVLRWWKQLRRKSTAQVK